jgi:hypothetical protein
MQFVPFPRRKMEKDRVRLKCHMAEMPVAVPRFAEEFTYCTHVVEPLVGALLDRCIVTPADSHEHADVSVVDMDPKSGE